MSRKSKKRKASAGKAATPASGQPLSLKAYARHRGCSQSAVQRAIRDGRIRSATRDGRGWWKIDANAADQEWDANTHPAKQRPAETSVPNAFRPKNQGGLFPEIEADAEGAKLPPNNGRGPISANMQKAQALKLVYSARLQQLIYEEKIGVLVKADQVTLQAFTTARAVRDALNRIPERIAGALAGLDSEVECRNMLRNEIAQALEALSEQGTAAK